MTRATDIRSEGKSFFAETQGSGARMSRVIPHPHRATIYPRPVWELSEPVFLSREVDADERSAGSPLYGST